MDLGHLIYAKLICQGQRKNPCHLEPTDIAGEHDSSQTPETQPHQGHLLRPNAKTEPRPNASPPLNPQVRALHCHQIGPWSSGL